MQGLRAITVCFLSLLALSGCRRDDGLSDAGGFSAVVEQLAAGTYTGLAALPTAVLASTATEIALYEPGEQAISVDDRGIDLYGAAQLSGVSGAAGGGAGLDAGGEMAVLATAAGLMELAGAGEDRYAGASALQAILPGAPTRVAAAGADLWVQIGGELYCWRNGALQRAGVGEVSLDGPLAAGGQRGGLPVIWAAGDEQVVAISRGGRALVEAVETRAAVGSMGADSAGTLWAAEDGALLEIPPEGEPRRYALPEAVTWAGAGTGAAGAWALTAGGLYRVEGDQYALAGLDGLIPEPGVVDGQGRLVFASEGGLWRVGRDRELLLVGMAGTVAAPEQIEGIREVRLVPTFPDRIATLEARIGDLPLEISGDSSVVIDASQWFDGADHTLTATATWSDGGAATGSAVFRSEDVGVVSWAGQIGPIYTEQCALCHGGDTETLLDSPEAWQARIDDILANVRSGAMPLGRDPLSAAQIAMIDAWKEGGFLLE